LVLRTQEHAHQKEFAEQVENFIKENKHLGYTTMEEFFQDVARWRLRFLNNEYEYVEVRKHEYEKLVSAIKEMDLPFLGVTDFIEQQIKSVLKKHSKR